MIPLAPWPGNTSSSQASAIAREPPVGSSTVTLQR
jgi:hypothetical protein